MTRFRATRHRFAASTLIASLSVISAACRSTPDTDVPGLLQRQTQQKRGRWKLIASQVPALRDDPPAIPLAVSTLDEYVGIYSLTPEVTYTIRREGDRLVGNRTGRQPEELNVELRDCLFVPGQSRLRKIFQRDAKGAVTGFVERRESWDIAWRRLPGAHSD